MVDLKVTFEKTLDKLLEEKKYLTVKNVLSTMAGEDVAAIIQELPEKTGPLIFRLLPKELLQTLLLKWKATIRKS